MYKLYFFLLCAMLCTSCSKKYKIEGTSSVSMLDGKMLFIKIPVGDKLVNIDSAEVIHGLFEMQGKVDSTVLASLYMDDECIMPLVIEPGHIDIQIDNAGITIKGTPLNDCFNDFVCCCFIRDAFFSCRYKKPMPIRPRNQILPWLIFNCSIVFDSSSKYGCIGTLTLTAP